MCDRSTDFSVVMPIHNESELLKLSLPSVFRLDPAETILIFDNCTDDSYNVAVEIAKRTKFFEKTNFKVVVKKKGLSFRLDQHS